jgi:hypothetical protein
MSKDDARKSHERERAALAIDPKLGHGDVVTRGKLKRALEHPDAVDALQSAAASNERGTDAAPRKPSFLNTQEYKLARKLVGATKGDTAGAPNGGGPAQDPSRPATEDDTTVVQKRGPQSVRGNTQRLIPDDPGDAAAHVEVPIVNATKVEVPGGERLVVAGEVARRLPAGDPTAATTVARLTPEKLEELDEKANAFMQANLAGLEVPSEARAERVQMIGQLVAAEAHKAAAREAERRPAEEAAPLETNGGAEGVSDHEQTEAAADEVAADRAVAAPQVPSSAARGAQRTGGVRVMLVVLAVLVVGYVAWRALRGRDGTESSASPSATTATPTTPISDTALASSASAPAVEASSASPPPSATATPPSTAAATSAHVRPSAAPSSSTPPPPASSSGRPDPGGFNE